MDQLHPAEAVPGSRLNSPVRRPVGLGSPGVALSAGHVVPPGAVCARVPVKAGDSLTGTLAGKIGSLTAHFEDRWKESTCQAPEPSPPSSGQAISEPI